jgi:hypothetical protein
LPQEVQFINAPILESDNNLNRYWSDKKMSTLKERLDRIKASFLKSAPAEAIAVMDRATEELRASDILSHIPTPGSRLPDFELPDSKGQLVRSSELLGQGPLILSFYRGLW